MKKLVLSLGVLAMLTGCATYQASSLAALDPIFVQDTEEIEGMRVGCKAFSKKECDQYFDRNVLAAGYQPVQLTFQNDSDTTYFFSVNGVNQPCARPEDVAKRVHTSTSGRIIGYSLAGLVLTPFFIPAVVDGIKSSNANKRLDADYDEKAKSSLILLPGTYHKTVLFVPKNEFSPHMRLTLIDEKTKESKSVQLRMAN